MLSERWQGCSAQWACCLFWLCDFPLGINDFFDGSEDAFVPAWFWPFSELGLWLFGFFIRWEHVGGSAVCYSLKKEKIPKQPNNQNQTCGQNAEIGLLPRIINLHSTEV